MWALCSVIYNGAWQYMRKVKRERDFFSPSSSFVWGAHCTRKTSCFTRMKPGKSFYDIVYRLDDSVGNLVASMFLVIYDDDRTVRQRISFVLRTMLIAVCCSQHRYGSFLTPIVLLLITVLHVMFHHRYFEKISLSRCSVSCHNTVCTDFYQSIFCSTKVCMIIELRSVYLLFIKYL